MKKIQNQKILTNRQAIDFFRPKIKKVSALLVICLWVIISAIPVNAQDNQDNTGNGTPVPTGTALVLQPGIGLRYGINKKLKLYQDFRPYYNQSDPSRNFEELSFGARYNLGHVNKFYFSTTLGYLFTFDNNYKISAYRPKVYFTTSYHLNKIRFEFRNRLEYSIITGQNSGASLRYRPRFRVSATYKLNQFRFTPYIYNESFFGQNGFSQNRTKLALSVRYHDFRVTVGNMLKMKPGKGFVENRVSMDLNYTIPTFTKKKQTK